MKRIIEILEEEKRLAEGAIDKYKNYYTNAKELNNLLFSPFISSSDPRANLFLIFYGEVVKCNTLALLSAVRLHHCQVVSNLRLMMESAVNAAYAIENYGEDAFAEFEKFMDNSTERTRKKMSRERYSWLEKHEVLNDTIKNVKKMLNKTGVHSNIAYAFKTFSSVRGKITIDFFDFEDADLVAGDLWSVGNNAWGALKLFHEVNKESGILRFKDDFLENFNELGKENNDIKEELMSKIRFKKYKKDT